jgi:uncharacterized membrane protein YtjA (UPF0391 family)
LQQIEGNAWRADCKSICGETNFFGHRAQKIGRPGPYGKHQEVGVSLWGRRFLAVPPKAAREAKMLVSQRSIRQSRRFLMFQWALVFLIVAIIAGLLGLSGVAGAATNIAWLLFLVGIVLAVIFFIRGRGPVR